MGRSLSTQSADREQFACSVGSGAGLTQRPLIEVQRPFHFADLSTVHEVQPMAAFSALRPKNRSNAPRETAISASTMKAKSNRGFGADDLQVMSI